MGIANTLGRIVLGFISDKAWINRLMVYNLCLTICGIGEWSRILLTGPLPSIFSSACQSFRKWIHLPLFSLSNVYKLHSLHSMVKVIFYFWHINLLMWLKRVEQNLGPVSVMRLVPGFWSWVSIVIVYQKKTLLFFLGVDFFFFFVLLTILSLCNHWREDRTRISKCCSYDSL